MLNSGNFFSEAAEQMQSEGSWRRFEFADILDYLDNWNSSVFFLLNSFVELQCKNLLFPVSFRVLLVTAKVGLK